MPELAEKLGRTFKSVDNEIYKARVAREARGISAPKILILDIEVAPSLVMVHGLYEQDIRSSQIYKDWYVLSFAAKWFDDGPDIMVGKVLEPQEALEGDDRRVCAEAWELLNEADIVVGHNIDDYDKKRLNWRFAIHKFGPPLPYKTVDTLKVARKVFGASSKEMSYLADRLGLRRKGHAGLWLARQCMEGSEESLSKLLSYNINDVIVQEEMYRGFLPWIPNHPNLALYLDNPETVCPNCGSKEIVPVPKRVTTGANAFLAFRCKSCDYAGRTKQKAISKEQRKALLK